MICTTYVGADGAPLSWVGMPCADCGHTTTAHPGLINPGLTACLVCQVQDSLDQLRTDRADQAELLAVHSAELDGLRARIEQLEARP